MAVAFLSAPGFRIFLTATEAITWKLSEGTHPFRADFTVSAEDALAADKISGADGKVSLTLGSSNKVGEKIVFDNLYITGIVPGPTPYLHRVQVADRRWLWAYKHVLRRFNVQRRIGIKRRDTWGKLPNRRDPITPEVSFAPYSLFGGRWKWSLEEMLHDILTDVVPRIEIKISPNVEMLKGGSSDVVIDDRLDNAVAHILAKIPGAALMLDEKGNVIVYQKATGTEKAMIESFGPEVVGSGDFQLITSDGTRPKEIHALFSREVEVRFDFNENGTSSITVDSPFAQNVLPSPDFTTDVGGVPMAQGTYITFDQAFAAWSLGALSDIRINHALVRRALFGSVDIWASIEKLGPVSFGSDRALWMGRVRAIQNHYRMTYRISRRWVDRILSFRPYLVATVDPVSGTRAPALAFMDYAVIHNQKRFANPRDIERQALATNHPWPAGNLPTAGDQIAPAPCDVSILDEDQGIIRLQFLADPYGMEANVFPGRIRNIPVFRPGLFEGEEVIAWNHEKATSNVAPFLDDVFDAAILLTAIPASPNDNRQLHRVVVKPGDVKDRVPKYVQDSIENAAGPILEVRIPASVETARIAWDDNNSDLIQRLFGALPGGVSDSEVDAITTNLDSNNVATVGSITEVARAAAASVYTEQVDRMRGVASFAARVPNVSMAGQIDEFAFTVDSSGGFLMGVSVPDNIDSLDMFAMMDAGTRAFVMRTATL